MQSALPVNASIGAQAAATRRAQTSPMARPRRSPEQGVRQQVGTDSAQPRGADYVTIPVAAAMTGYSPKAIRRKIEAGVWLDGREFRRAPDGHVLISVKGHELWVERGRA